MIPSVSRSFVATASGRVHVAESGDGPPVLLLHQTPRSWDEYRDVLPRLGRTYRAIAADTRGFGQSEPLPEARTSIEGWADAALELLDALGIRRVALVGHHTGSAIAIEIAARAPDRVAAAILSAPPYVDAARRAAHLGRRVIDDVETGPDGRHLTALWNARRPFYPADRPELLERYVIDALRSGALAAEGHRVVDRYRMEERLARVACPTIVLSPTGDPHAHPACRRVAEAISGSAYREIEGAMVPFPDQMPDVFADAVVSFLDPVAPRW